MRINNVISFSLFNAFTLLFLASTLASCQKTSQVKKTGHFSSIRQSRSIASLTSHDKSFDPRQVYVYCATNSRNLESCYNDKVKRLEIKNTKSFEAVGFEVKEITKSILAIVKKDISKNLDKRKSFCLKNSKHFFKKCLTQYVERDSMVTLNKYQSQNKGINGYEYIHLKRSIASVYSSELNAFYNAEVEMQKKN